MRYLYAWENDTLIGRFYEDDGKVSFAYARDATSPISLSLPLNGNWHEDAPLAFLDGLLPEGQQWRIQMKNSLKAASTDSFDLLDSVDSTGGLVFTSQATSPSLKAEASIATDADIESQMQRIYDVSNAWWNENDRNRFSLAGNQGKFSLAFIHGTWFWPNATLPSTHIMKPDPKATPDVALVEHATLEIARQIGIRAAATSVVRYGARVGLLVERFDRVVDLKTKTIRRLRTEDMTQATGAWGKDKYDFEIGELIQCLRQAHADESVIYGLVRQIAFNACIGNHDAHAKNYSVFIERNGIRLCPLYDAISMAHWPVFRDDVLAMPVNGVYDPWEVTIDDWREEAKAAGLDPDRVEHIVHDVVESLRRVDYEGLPCGQDIGAEIRDYMLECCRDLA